MSTRDAHGRLFREGERRRFEASFENARTVGFPDVGHFVPEEAGSVPVDPVGTVLAGLG